MITTIDAFNASLFKEQIELIHEELDKLEIPNLVPNGSYSLMDVRGHLCDLCQMGSPVDVDHYAMTGLNTHRINGKLIDCGAHRFLESINRKNKPQPAQS